MARVAQRHPLRVLCTILGVPREQEDHLLELTSQLLAADDPDLQRQGADRNQASHDLGMEFYSMFNEIIEDRRANPRADLASMLANVTFDDGEPMGLIETLGYYLIVFNAGHDTTRHSLSAAFEAFADHPDELRRLRENPSLVSSAVEEVVRWSAPVNYMKRTVVDDTTFGGVQMKAGQNLALFYASANRDESVFDDPLRFDVGRNPNRHLGFGWAEHYCLGAHLAREHHGAPRTDGTASRGARTCRPTEPGGVELRDRPQDPADPVPNRSLRSRPGGLRGDRGSGTPACSTIRICRRARHAAWAPGWRVRSVRRSRRQRGRSSRRRGSHRRAAHAR